MLEECRSLLNNIFLQHSVSDRWIWQPDIGEGYTICGAYQLLTSQVHHVVDAADNLIWHKHVPLKVSILAWRLLRNRLPTKENLLNRGIIPTDANLCVTGCGKAESAVHLFLHCDILGTLW